MTALLSSASIVLLGNNLPYSFSMLITPMGGDNTIVTIIGCKQIPKTKPSLVYNIMLNATITGQIIDRIYICIMQMLLPVYHQS